MIETFRSLFAPPRHFIPLVVALWIGLTLAEKRSEQYHVSKEQLNNLTFYSLVGFIVGGRILFAMSNLSSFSLSPLSILSLNPDLFDSFGGSITAILAGIIYIQRQQLSTWDVLDAATPIFSIGAVGLSLAHLAAGTGFGKPTDLPWGIELWNATRHPSQIYDLVTSLFIFSLVWQKKPDAPGSLFLLFSSWTAGFHLFLDAFRADGRLVFGDLRLQQIIAWSILAGAYFAGEYIRESRSPNRE